MKNKEIKKIQFGGWNKMNWKELRKEIKRRDVKDLEIADGGLVSKNPHKVL